MSATSSSQRTPAAVHLGAGAQAIDLLTVAVLGGALLFAPLCFGAVQRWAWTPLLVALAALAGLRAVAGLARGEPGVAFPAAPALVAAGLVGLVVGVQQVPLPAAMTAGLAPFTAGLDSTGA